QVFSNENLAKDAQVKDAIESQVQTAAGLDLSILNCLSLPRDEKPQKHVLQFCRKIHKGTALGGLCQRLSRWLLTRLVALGHECKKEVPECLKELVLPLTQSALTQLTQEGDTVLYAARQISLPEVPAHLLQSEDDSVSPYFASLMGDASSLSVHAMRRVRDIVTKKNPRRLPEARRKVLFATLRTYYLADLRSAPHVDPLLLALLSLMTEKMCTKQRKKKVVVAVAGRNTKVKAQDIMIVAWSHLIKAMTKTTICSPTGTENTNCDLLSRYVQWKTVVNQQLLKGSHEAATAAEGLLAEARGFTRLAEKVQRQAANDFLFGDSIRHLPFGALIDFLGKWRWLRKLLMKVARGLVEKMLPGVHLRGRVQKKGKQVGLQPVQRFALALHYGLKKEAEVFMASGREGVARVIGQMVRGSVKDLLRREPNARISPQTTAVSSFYDASPDPRTSIERLVLRQGANETRSFSNSMVVGSARQAVVRRISLVQSDWTAGEKRAVVGIIGLVTLMVGISGLSAGPAALPIAFIIVGAAMCLGAVVLSLKDMNLLPPLRSGAAGAGRVEEEEEEEDAEDKQPLLAKQSSSEAEEESW
ncbi:transmembrane protein, partial [Cystoisospora suis]